MGTGGDHRERNVNTRVHFTTYSKQKRFVVKTMSCISTSGIRLRGWLRLLQYKVWFVWFA